MRLHAQASQYAQQVLTALESAHAAGTDVIQVDKVPAAYSGLVELIAPGRKHVAAATVEQHLDSACAYLKDGPPSNIWRRMGWSAPSVQERKTHKIADELTQLVGLDTGARYACVVAAGIHHGRSNS